MENEHGAARSLAWGGSLGGLCASLLVVVLSGGLVAYVSPRFEGDPAAVVTALQADGLTTFALWLLLLSGAVLVGCSAGSWWLRPQGLGGGRAGASVLGALVGFAAVVLFPFALALYLAGVR